MWVVWSVGQAARLLDPPATEAQVRALIALANLQPAGTGAPRGRGRPPVTYRAADLMRAHARAIRAGLLELLPPVEPDEPDEPSELGELLAAEVTW